MRVASVGFSSAYKNISVSKNQQPKMSSVQKPSFKADVRLNTWCNLTEEEYPEKDAKEFFESLVYAYQKYQNIGSDNILIYLTPVFKEGSWRKKPSANIQITAMFKDIDRAVKEVKEKLKDKEEFKKHIWGAEENKPEKINNAINFFNEKPTAARDFYKQCMLKTDAREPFMDKNTTVTKKDIDERMTYVIDTMEHELPYENSFTPFCWIFEDRIEDYDPEEYGMLQRQALKYNYPDWEKELWDKLGFDYNTRLEESGDILAV